MEFGDGVPFFHERFLCRDDGAHWTDPSGPAAAPQPDPEKPC